MAHDLSSPLTVQSERKPSKTTDVMVGVFPFCVAAKAALLATAGVDPGAAITKDSHQASDKTQTVTQQYTPHHANDTVK